LLQSFAGLFPENTSFFLLAELAFYNFLPKKTYCLLNGTSNPVYGWASCAGGLPPAQLINIEGGFPTEGSQLQLAV
jgi:hypothetical protein